MMSDFCYLIMVLGKISTQISHTLKYLNQKFLSKLKIPHFFENCICELFIARLRKQNLDQILEMWDLS